MKKTFLITGATGTIGSQLLKKLRGEGHYVYCVVRSRPNQNFSDRLTACSGSELLQGDITEPFCGLSDLVIEQLKGRVDAVIHSAALLKFEESFEQDLRKVNCGGTKNTIALADAIEASEFHYVSTAYVAGSKDELAEHEFVDSNYARNPYEKTKQESENIVRERYYGTNKCSIYRLGIVTGCSKTGFTPAYDGYFGWLGSFWHFRKQLREMAESSQPIEFVCNRNITLNLVPLDWTVDMLGMLVVQDCADEIYHLTHPCPPKASWILSESLKFLEIPHRVASSISDSDNRHQRLVNKGIKRYLPYVLETTRWSNDNLKSKLGESYFEAPIIDLNVIRTWLCYAREDNFGKVDKKLISSV